MSEGKGVIGIHIEQDSERQLADSNRRGSSLSPAKARSHHQWADADLGWAREKAQTWQQGGMRL